MEYLHIPSKPDGFRNTDTSIEISKSGRTVYLPLRRACAGGAFCGPINGKTIRGSANARHKPYHVGMRVCLRRAI